MLYVDPAAHSYALRSAETTNGPGREKEVLQEFEQVFINQLLKEMRKTVQGGGLTEKSQQQQYFEEILDDHLAGEMARSGQLGIARQMEAQLAALEAARKRPREPLPAEGLPLHPPAKALRLDAHTQGMALPKKNQGFPFEHGHEGIPLKQTSGKAFGNTGR